MPDLFFPSYTKKILSALNVAGYEAYLVGGAVRDLLLGKSPDDYDITHSAADEIGFIAGNVQGRQYFFCITWKK